MSKRCYICGKSPASGHAVSHSNRKTKRRWLANLQRVRIQVDNTTKRVNLCTRCIRSGKKVAAIS